MRIKSNLQRQSWPKQQPRPRKSSPRGFSEAVRQIISHRSAGMCELDFCGPAEQYHHRAPRGRGGTRLEWVNSAANGFHVAAHCHDRIERNREAARENGWLVDRNGTAAATEVPVLRRGIRVMLSDDGSVTPVKGAA